MLPGVDLAGIVKNKQHLDFLPGEGPHEVISSVDASTTEATEALQEISLATPARKSEHDNAMGSAKDGGKDGKMKYSGKATKDQKLKKLKKQSKKTMSIEALQCHRSPSDSLQ